MTKRTWIVGTAAIVFAAGCTKAPAPLNDAERAAITDSVNQIVTQMFASLAQSATAEQVLGYLVKGNELVSAGNGMIFPTYDSLVKVANAQFRPGTKLDVKLDQRRLAVLDRDVVVVGAMLGGVWKDSAGNTGPVREAWTAVYHRTPDGWMIAADHSSSPPPAPTPAKPAHRR